MVDVSAKPDTSAHGPGDGMHPDVAGDARRRSRANAVAKGDVLGVARVAGIMAAKRTSELIPLCHPLPLTRRRRGALLPTRPCRGSGWRSSRARSGKTGVEMEALTGSQS